MRSKEKADKKEAGEKWEASRSKMRNDNRKEKGEKNKIMTSKMARKGETQVTLEEQIIDWIIVKKAYIHWPP